MHDGEDRDHIVSHAVHYAVRGVDYLAQHRIGQFGNDAARQRKHFESIDGGDDTFGDDTRIAWGVFCDMIANVQYVDQRGPRPDEAHRVSQRASAVRSPRMACRASSWDPTSPRPAASKPRATLARK